MDLVKHIFSKHGFSKEPCFHKDYSARRLISVSLERRSI